MIVDETWLDADGIKDQDVWKAFLNADREVPGGIPVRALTRHEWWKRIVIPSVELTAPRA